MEIKKFQVAPVSVYFTRYFPHKSLNLKKMKVLKVSLDGNVLVCIMTLKT